MTAKRRLLLHVGQTKAGSTSIQNYLETEHDPLLAEGVLFPLSIIEHRNSFDPRRTAGHLKFVKMLRAGTLKEFEIKLDQHPEHRLVLSSESLFSDQPDETLALIGEYFEGWEVDLVAVLRPQFDWLRSRHIEYIMSDFHSCDLSFRQFVRDFGQSGILDYAERLQWLGEILRAQRVSAIGFDGVGSLVDRFFNTGGLPVTDMDRAASIRDNVREKAEFLIEAKRRLNSLTTHLSRNTQFELEYCLQNEAAPMIAADPTLAEPSVLVMPLNTEQIAALKVLNYCQSGMFELDHPLPLGEQPSVSTQQDVAVMKATETRFLEGLKVAAELAKARCGVDHAASEGYVLDLEPEELTVLVNTLAYHPVSPHLNSPATAVLPTSLGGRMAVLALRHEPLSYQVMSRLNRLATASPLLPLDIQHDSDWTAEKLRDLPDKFGLLRPGVIVLGPRAGLSYQEVLSRWQEERVLIVVFGEDLYAGGLVEERRTHSLWTSAINTLAPAGSYEGLLSSRTFPDACND